MRLTQQAQELALLEDLLVPGKDWGAEGGVCEALQLLVLLALKQHVTRATKQLEFFRHTDVITGNRVKNR